MSKKKKPKLNQIIEPDVHVHAHRQISMPALQKQLFV